MKHAVYNIPSIHLAVLLVVGLAVFSNTLAGDFVWEDRRLVAENYHIRDYRNIPLFFTADHWKESRPSAPDAGFRPLREVSFAVDYRIWGLNPRGFHLTNLLLHLINIALVYGLVLKLMSATRQSFFLSPAFFAALFFALHPIHTESVAYIKNRSDLLAFIFYQSAFLLFIFRDSSALTRRSAFYYTGALFCFLMALWSKPMAVSLPLVLVLYVVGFPRARQLSKRVVDTLPFFGLALVYYWFQKFFLIAAEPEKIGFDPGSWRHIGTVVKTLGWYLKMLVWPAPLNIWHDFHPPAGLMDVTVVPSMIALFLIIAMMIKTFASDRLCFFGLGWILITLIPVANFFVLYDRPIAEQRLYIPSFGFCLALALIVRRMPGLIKRISDNRPATLWLPYVMTGVICAAYAFITVDRNFEWRDSVSLFSSAVDRSSDLAWAHNRLGSALKEKGRLDEAIFHHQAALAIKPRQAAVYNDIGAVLGEKGQFEEAISCFETALTIQPDFSLAHDNLGLALSRQGRLDEALRHYRKALALEPKNALRHSHLAAALAVKGRLKEAIDHYQTALALNPYDAVGYSRLGAILLERNDQAEACRYFIRAREIDPAAFALPSCCRQ